MVKIMTIGNGADECFVGDTVDQPAPAPTGVMNRYGAISATIRPSGPQQALAHPFGSALKPFAQRRRILAARGDKLSAEPREQLSQRRGTVSVADAALNLIGEEVAVTVAAQFIPDFTDERAEAELGHAADLPTVTSAAASAAVTNSRSSAPVRTP